MAPQGIFGWAVVEVHATLRGFHDAGPATCLIGTYGPSWQAKGNAPDVPCVEAVMASTAAARSGLRCENLGAQTTA